MNVQSQSNKGLDVQRTTSIELLPAPFAWMDIPAGKVTLIDHHHDSYFGKKEEKKIFDLPAFKIAKYSVTNAQYSLFMKAGGYTQRRWWTDDGWDVRLQGWAWDEDAYRPSGNAWLEPRFWQDDKWNKPDYPVVGVSWYEAIAYCNWLSEATGEQIMLPTEQQWQRAAHGDTNSAYAWGDQFDNARCNYNTDGTTPVTHFDGKGNSPFGVVDMTGNVWEWNLTDHESGENNFNKLATKRVQRGGSWRDEHDILPRADFRGWYYPYGWIYDIGFRLSIS
jgi:formylglycine-generating enzyme required for sulfatase activity